MAVVTKKGVVIHEGSLNLPENSNVKERIQQIIKTPSSRLTGASFYKEMLWVGIDSLGVCNDAIAKTILNGLGIDEVILNGVRYKKSGKELPIASAN